MPLGLPFNILARTHIVAVISQRPVLSDPILVLAAHFIWAIRATFKMKTLIGFTWNFFENVEKLGKLTPETEKLGNLNVPCKILWNSEHWNLSSYELLQSYGKPVSLLERQSIICVRPDVGSLLCWGLIFFQNLKYLRKPSNFSFVWENEHIFVSLFKYIDRIKFRRAGYYNTLR